MNGIMERELNFGCIHIPVVLEHGIDEHKTQSCWRAGRK